MCWNQVLLSFFIFLHWTNLIVAVYFSCFSFCDFLVSMLLLKVVGVFTFSFRARCDFECYYWTMDLLWVKRFLWYFIHNVKVVWLERWIVLVVIVEINLLLLFPFVSVLPFIPWFRFVFSVFHFWNLLFDDVFKSWVR